MKRLAAALLLTGLAGPANAALPPCAYDELVAEAALVVQLAVAAVEAPAEGTICTVEGTVLTVFRGLVSVGDALTVPVQCRLVSDIAGPTIATGPETLSRAAVIEFHLDPDGRPAGHGAGVVILEAATEESAYEPFCGE